MAQIFHPSANAIAKGSIFGAVFIVAILGYIASAIDRSPYTTDAGVIRSQPVPFSHEHHVKGLGLDCRYCHTSVETSSFAGIPPTKTCMTCHSQIWTNAPLLEPVRASWRDDRPLVWSRVHNLPDFVYFNHSAHIAKGVGCSTCHGRVDQMPLMYQEKSLQMEWCLDCHRAPEKYLRPRDQVFNMNYEPPPADTQLQEGAELARKYNVHHEQMTNCAVCHR
jgi:hypothetical protein